MAGYPGGGSAGGGVNLYEGPVSVYLGLASEFYYIDTIQIDDLYIIEDIFSYSVSGKLQFNDRMGVLEFGPLTGNELIYISYGVEQEYARTFQIHKINRVKPISGNSEGKYNTVELFFVDRMFINLMSKEFSRSWPPKTKYSDIIRHIAEEMINIKTWNEFEDSNEKIENFCMTYWTPLQAINWLMKRCTGTQYGTPSFVFFNNLSDNANIASNFVTLDKLIKNPILDIGGGGKYIFHDKNPNLINRILSYDVSGLDNLSKQELKGGIRRGYDFKNKKFLEKEFQYSGMVPKHTMLGKKSLFDDISDPNTLHENLGFDDKSIIDNYYSNEWIKRYDLQQTVSITVTGHEKRYAGGLVEIDWKSVDDKEEINKNLSKYYLIKSITHHFVPNAKPPYRQKLVLIKNAYFESDRGDLVNTSKKRL